MRPPRPASRLRFCVVGSRWESLGEGLGDPGGREGRDCGLGWCLRKGKGGKRTATSGCGQPGPCIPAPGARGRPKAERATLSCCFCHGTRTPEPGKALGLCLWESPRKEPRDPLRFQTFPSSFPAKSTSRCLVTHWLPPPCGENWLLGCKTGRSE